MNSRTNRNAKKRVVGWLLYDMTNSDPFAGDWNFGDIYQSRREAERVKAPYERIVKVELRRSK